MPKVGRMSESLRKVIDDFIKEYGGTMSLADIQLCIGVGSPHTAEKWVEGLPVYRINKRRRWKTSDVARRFEACREL